MNQTLFPQGLSLLATLCAVGMSALHAGAASTATLTVQADQPGISISPMLYGIFFEEINCAGDGGLYAELIRNRSFEDADTPAHWSLVTNGGAQGTMAIDDTAPMSPQNPHALKLEITSTTGGSVGVANGGYWGIPVRKGESYRFALNAKGGGNFTGPLVVSLESTNGQVYARKKIKSVGPQWQPYQMNLSPSATDPHARLTIIAEQTGTVWLDMVSLFPKKTWQGRDNGLRTDLADKLNGLKPAFVRFPGGCWVEGDRLKDSYRWKQTIGSVADRRDQYNIWQYYSTHGLGYHEYLQMCEDLRAEPLFVINCGMSHKENVPLAELGPWVQDALDAIEYANGAATSEWGAVRTKNGHPKPFNLKYLEIGNENGGPAYHERYARFYDAIKAKYPDLHLIANVWGGSPTNRPAEIVDEHYYANPQFFIQNANKYDTYKRTGPKIYVGEYAVTTGCGQGNLIAALGEAAFMTGMERNADVVVMASYAPLFANANYKKWNPDLINFDSSRSYGTPSYYAQKMFADHRADQVLPTQVTVTEFESKPVKHQGGIGLGAWETQVEYKDVRVTQGDKVLFADDFATDTKKWKALGGNWQVSNGVYRQTAEGSDLRAIAGDASWTDYSYSVKARKISGNEGFLILFHVKDDDHWLWFNVGGWGNTQHAIEMGETGGKSIVGEAVPGKIEANRWYDLRVDVKGDQIQCYLDGKLIHDVRQVPVQLKPLHAVAGTASHQNEIILKVVNVSDTAQETDVDIQGVKGLRRQAAAYVLTSGAPTDENSLTNLVQVAPVCDTVAIPGPHFKHTFPPYSLTVLRLRPTR